ncbi:MAG TPA: hypothetical protein VFW00_02135, partial [Rhodocyclaceae bacterium]|nr:hypothetical protein [Rhodocyclaceae bacterium]
SNESAKPAAQQLWRDTMAALQTEPSHAPATPDGVVSNVVVFDPPLEPARREWFIKGTDTDTESYKRF